MKKSTKISAAALSVTLLGMATFPLANAAELSDDIRISNYESVSATMSSTGEVTDAIIVDQLTILGNGQVAVANPVAGEKVRNLSTFEKLAGTGGVVETTVDVNGSQELRTLNDYEGDLPVTLSAKYLLDGEEIDPDTIDKVTGHLEVQYTVTNQTGQMEEISYVNAAGETVTKEVMIYTPIAGEFVTDLPSSFSNAEAAGAAVAADGRGNTRIKFSLTLLPPLSAPETTFSYSADLVDGTLPAANLTVIPVKPYENSTASSAVGSYESGAEAGSTIYAGGSAMNDGLGQLADGAGTLMAGIAKLYAGSGDLKAGLESASSGAASLNDGAYQLKDGLSEMQSAVGMLDKIGAFKLITSGLKKISASNDTIVAELDKLSAELDSIEGQLAAVVGDIDTAKGLATDIKDRVAVATDADGVEVDVDGLVDQLVAALDEALDNVAAAQEDVAAGDKAIGVLTTDKPGTTIPGLGAIPGKKAPVNEIAAQVTSVTGMVDMLSGLILGKMADGVNQLAAGSEQLAAGTDTLMDGAGQLLDGATQINDGLGQADGNMPALMAGIDKLTKEGAQQFMSSGLDTQMEYEELVTQVAAAAKRTDDGALPVGAPEGAHAASAAYVFDIDGTRSEGLSPMALAGIAAGIFAAAGIGLAVAGRRRS